MGSAVVDRKDPVRSSHSLSGISGNTWPGWVIDATAACRLADCQAGRGVPASAAASARMACVNVLTHRRPEIWHHRKTAEEAAVAVFIMIILATAIVAVPLVLGYPPHEPTRCA
jgi:hypothetical protein